MVNNWILIILGFLSVVGIALWSRLTKKMDDLIATEVEKRINRFQETVEQVDTLTNELNEAVGQVKIQQDRIKDYKKRTCSHCVRGCYILPFRILSCKNQRTHRHKPF